MPEGKKISHLYYSSFRLLSTVYFSTISNIQILDLHMYLTENPFITIIKFFLSNEYSFTWTTKGWHATMEASQIAEHPIVVPDHAIVHTPLRVHITHPSICESNKKKKNIKIKK